jgi:hypothetical protein
MAVGGQSLSVTSGAAVLLASVPAEASNIGPVGSVVITNGSGGVVQLSGQGVTTTTGYPMAASTTITVTLYAGDALYAIAASATSTVNVLQT